MSGHPAQQERQRSGRKLVAVMTALAVTVLAGFAVKVVVHSEAAQDSGSASQRKTPWPQSGAELPLPTEASRPTDSGQILASRHVAAGAQVTVTPKVVGEDEETLSSVRSIEPNATPVLRPTGIPGTGLIVRLPLANTEVGADGLPVSGVRCNVDGGTFQCGACLTDSDCPAGKGCVTNRETHRLECVESDCTQDVDCLPGLVCRAVTPGIAGPVIRRCSPEGLRHEGEPCDSVFVSQTGACEEGLVCHRGECSRPCVPGEASSCQQGYVCEEGVEGAACFADCRAQGCAEGQQCKRLNDTDYQCLTSVQGECPELACGQGERCNMRVSRGHGVFWCAQLCNPLQADSCPSGQVCGVGGPTASTCYQRCDPMQPDSCDKGWQCASVTEDLSQFGCRPMPHSDGGGVMSVHKP